MLGEPGEVGDTMDEEAINLGDKIQLIGFRICSKAEMVVVRKMVGNQVRKLMEHDAGFSQLVLHVKAVHEMEENRKYEIKGTIEASGTHHAEETHKNLFVCLDNVLKKLEASLSG